MDRCSANEIPGLKNVHGTYDREPLQSDNAVPIMEQRLKCDRQWCQLCVLLYVPKAFIEKLVGTDAGLGFVSVT